MNLFQNTNLVQAVRDAFDLSIPQASVVLIAYQHGSVSTLTVREVLDFDARTLSATRAISLPVHKGLLVEVGKGRVKEGSRPSSIYKLTNPKAIGRVVDEAAERSVQTYRKIDAYESEAKRIVYESR